jgi:pimeloyl-ACP methyl ester carboxylesterase
LNPLTSWRLADRKPVKAAPGRNLAQAAAPPVTVSVRWLAGACAVVVAVAALCAYGTLCLLFYQGQWQLVLHPARSVPALPSARGMKFDEVRFDYTETGIPRLAGWWIPAEPASRWGSSTVLYLHGGDGSLSSCLEDLAALHSLGINVFAFDYRGYGQSTGTRPSEARMREDAQAAWSYLAEGRRIDDRSIVIYGVGAGASLAAELAAKHRPAGVVLDAPAPPARTIVERDARARILPLFLLLAERFDPVEALQDKTTPKLFLDRAGASPRTGELYRAAASPKQYFELKPGEYDVVLRRFFGEVLR